MWPWGHLAVGYVAFSGFVRFRLGGRPSGRAALVLAVATQLPDLIDKPLIWQFGVLRSSVAHSLLVGVPIAMGLGIGLWARGRPEVGGAFAIGYGSHVFGDLLFGWLFGRPPLLQAFLWPLYRSSAPAAPGFGPKVWELLQKSTALLESSMGRVYFLLMFVLLVATLALWIADGAPGLDELRAVVRGQR
jgi:hypothetical protein